MCGRKSKTVFLFFLASFCLLSFSLSAQEDESQDGSNGYWVSEEELTRLENILEQQGTLLETQEEQLNRARTELSEAKSELTRALESINNLSLSIKRAESSLSRLESEVRLRTIANWFFAATTVTATILWILK